MYACDGHEGHMSYAKLFSRILDSTIWRESDEVRILWITMLAMADKDGMVYCTIPGLADRARISLTHCEAALERFQQPDKYSWSKDSEGRRIEVSDGGWFLINHGKYREMLSKQDVAAKAAERQRERRDRVSLGLARRMDSQGMQCGCCGAPFARPYSLYVVSDRDHATGQLRDALCQSCNKLVGQFENGATILDPNNRSMCQKYVTRHKMSQQSRHTDTDTDTEATTDTNTEVHSSIKLDPPTALRASRATRIPESFIPDEDHYLLAKELGVNCEMEFQKFRDYYLGVSGSKGAKLDWPATLRNWLKNSINFGGSNVRQVSKGQQRTQVNRANLLAGLALAQSSRSGGTIVPSRSLAGRDADLVGNLPDDENGNA